MILDLFNDFRDGSRLLDLLEVMSGQRLVSPLTSPCPPSGSRWSDEPADRLSACVFRVGREAAGCFSTGATLKRPFPS